jgi:hypothetical protein
MSRTHVPPWFCGISESSNLNDFPFWFLVYKVVEQLCIGFMINNDCNFFILVKCKTFPSCLEIGPRQLQKVRSMPEGALAFFLWVYNDH